MEFWLNSRGIWKTVFTLRADWKNLEQSSEMDVGRSIITALKKDEMDKMQSWKLVFAGGGVH